MTMGLVYLGTLITLYYAVRKKEQATCKPSLRASPPTWNKVNADKIFFSSVSCVKYRRHISTAKVLQASELYTSYQLLTFFSLLALQHSMAYYMMVAKLSNRSFALVLKIAESRQSEVTQSDFLDLYTKTESEQHTLLLDLLEGKVTFEDLRKQRVCASFHLFILSTWYKSRYVRYNSQRYCPTFRERPKKLQALADLRMITRR